MSRILAICREAPREPPAEEGAQKLRRTSYFSGAVAQLGGQVIERGGRPPTGVTLRADRQRALVQRVKGATRLVKSWDLRSAALTRLGQRNP